MAEQVARNDVSEVHVEALLSGLTPGIREDFAGLSEEERACFLHILQDPEIYPLLMELDFHTEPVSPRVFLDNPYYIGFDNKWDEGNKAGLYPVWKDELIYVLNPENRVYEWILSGSLGAGKTSVALISQMYWLYWLTCLRKPKQYLSVLSSSTIEIFLFNLTLDSARDTLLSRFENLINSSPYFREHLPPNRRRRYQKRPTILHNQENKNEIYKLVFPPYFSIVEGSRETHFMSRDVIGGVMDEANFMESKKSLGQGTYDSSSKAFSMYTSIRNRIITRFANQGRMTGLLCLISSAGVQNSFLELHKERCRTDSRVHISEYALYDVKPWMFKKKRFRVFLGTAQDSARILANEEPVDNTTEHLVITVPVDLRDEYVKDLEKALREYSGRATSATGSLIPIKEQIAATVSSRSKNPFTVQSPVIGHLSKATLTSYLTPHKLAKWDGSIRVPKFFPRAQRFIHVDLSKSRCATGFAMGCVSSIERTSEADAEGSSAETLTPRVWLDILLQIRPPQPPEEIDYAKIRAFIVYLRNVLHFPISLVTYDGYQSVDSVQILQRNGFEAEVLSIDSTPDAYLALRGTITENRLERYAYPPFETEVSQLQQYTDGRRLRIDHPPDGAGAGPDGKPSKDVSDSVAGVVWHCTRSVMSLGDHPPIVHGQSPPLAVVAGPKERVPSPKRRGRLESIAI